MPLGEFGVARGHRIARALCVSVLGCVAVGRLVSGLWLELPLLEPFDVSGLLLG